MAYIWINPVTDSMYEQDVLNAFLHKYGYKRLFTSDNWLSVVKEKYQAAVRHASNTVIDMRCPKTKELLDELDIASSATIPDIKPILIHCGQEASRREDLLDEEKIITTPCKALADMGNELELANTRFMPWNQFLESVGDAPESIFLEKSPIPPGFFESLGLKTDSVTGEEEIRKYFSGNVRNEVQLVEILFCKEGCHNGDGIRNLKNEE